MPHVNNNYQTLKVKKIILSIIDILIVVKNSWHCFVHTAVNFFEYALKSKQTLLNQKSYTPLDWLLQPAKVINGKKTITKNVSKSAVITT